MKVTQVCIGKFHHFHLARYLAEHGELAAIFSGYPWFRLKNEGLPRELVRTFPWVQAPYMAGMKAGVVSHYLPIQQLLEWWSAQSLDSYAARNLPECDVLVGLSGSGLQAGRTAQNRGGYYVCDRGSSHIVYQNRILTEEFARWGLKFPGIDPRIVDKELQEYATANLITVPSQFNVRTFHQAGIAPEKIAKVSYGANIASFQPVARPDPAKFVVLFVGEVSLRKGIPDLLEAFAKFQHPRKELLIVGPVAPIFQPLLKRFNLSGVVLLGPQPQTQLAKLYSQANVFVLPSIEEGLAMVQGEALACGCPVIGTTHSGAEDLFTNGREGFIVPIRDPDAIAKRLTELAENPLLQAEMRAAAFDRVQSIGGWEDYGRNYQRCLKQLVASPLELAAQHQ